MTPEQEKRCREMMRKQCPGITSIADFHTAEIVTNTWRKAYAAAIEREVSLVASERDRYRELVEELLASDEEVSSVTDDELSDAAQKAPCPAARRQAEVILAARQALKAGKEGA